MVDWRSNNAFFSEILNLLIIIKQTMFVAQWELKNIPDKPDLTSAHIWIKLLNVPFQLFNEDGL